MRKPNFLKLFILLAWVAIFFFFSFIPRSAVAHNTATRSSFALFYAFGGASFYSYRRPAMQYSAAQFRRALNNVQKIVTLGETKRLNWLAAKNNSPQFIPTPVPTEPTLEAPKIENKKIEGALK